MKIVIDLPKGKDCRECCCCVEAKSRINDNEISFYLCRTFKRILTQAIKYDRVASVARCNECRDVEIIGGTKNENEDRD